MSAIIGAVPQSPEGSDAIRLTLLKFFLLYRAAVVIAGEAVAQSYKSITSDPAPTQASPRPSCPNGATGAASSPPLTVVVNVVNWNVRLKN